MDFLKKNLANMLTVFRLVLVPVFVVLMIFSVDSTGWAWAAFAVFTLAAVTDFVDGQVARRTNTVSDFGTMVDPLADRLLVAATVASLFVMRLMPLAFVLVVLARDLLMVAGYPFVKRIDASKVAVHMSGKVATAFLFVGSGLFVISGRPGGGSYFSFSGFDFLAFDTFQTWALWFYMVGMAFSLYSAAIYIRRVLALIKDERPSRP